MSRSLTSRAACIGRVARTTAMAGRDGIRARWSHRRIRDAAAEILAEADRDGTELILLGATDARRADHRILSRATRPARRVSCAGPRPGDVRAAGTGGGVMAEALVLVVDPGAAAPP